MCVLNTLDTENEKSDRRKSVCSSLKLAYNDRERERERERKKCSVAFMVRLKRKEISFEFVALF